MLDIYNRMSMTLRSPVVTHSVLRWTKRDVFVCVNSFLKNAEKPALFHTYDFMKFRTRNNSTFVLNEVSHMKMSRLFRRSSLWVAKCE